MRLVFISLVMILCSAGSFAQRILPADYIDKGYTTNSEAWTNWLIFGGLIALYYITRKKKD